MLPLLLIGCLGPGVQHSRMDLTGYAAYDVLPSRSPDPRTVALVRRALPIWHYAPSSRDQDIATFFEQHLSSWRFWHQIYRFRADWLYVVGELRTVGLPDLLAALPYQASRFEPYLDETCAGGPWMLPITTPGLAIGPCRLGSSAPWSAGDPRSPVDEGACWLADCVTDERNDLVSSTRVAIAGLQETWAANGHDLAATVAAHARYRPEAVVAQHLLAACAIGRVAPGSFPSADLDYCDEVDLPTPAEVAAAMPIP